MPDGPSSSRSRREALDSLTVDKARGLEVEGFGGAVVGVPAAGGRGHERQDHPLCPGGAERIARLMRLITSAGSTRRR
jgi:hypothetical protein